MLLFDAHLDLSLNAIEYNRDLRVSVHEIRRQEAGLCDLKGRQAGTVAFPEMRLGEIGICVATQLAGCMKPRIPIACWNSPEQAWAMTQAQLAWYRQMEIDGHLRQIVDRASLDRHLQEWNGGPAGAHQAAPIGYILSLEGADSIVTLDYLQTAWDYGLRALGPAHYGKGRYALGHNEDGALTAQGKELLRELDRLGIILDATHLCDRTFFEALELFSGPVWASHSNCRALVDDPRQFSDAQLRALIERGAVIGAPFDAWMMVPGWIRGTTTPAETNLKIAQAADHIDHICQLAGNARHCGIGSDLDGGYGREQTPCDLDTIADLQSVADILRRRGYAESDVEGVMHGNFVRFLRDAWK